MEDKIKDILDAYPFHVESISRGRGAFICHTDDGMKIIKAYHHAPYRLEFEQFVKDTMRAQGYPYIDQFQANVNGDYLTLNSQDGEKYTVRDWFEGRECDVKNAADVLSVVRQLASIHRLMRNIQCEHINQFIYEDTREIFCKRRKELRAIRSYIRSKKQWNDFEKLFMQVFLDSMEEVEHALFLLDEFAFDELRGQAIANRTLCHGDFNYHQALLNRKYTAIINFDKMHLDIQVQDLYQILRKVMEKNNWDDSLGILMIQTYDSVKPLSHEEFYYLYVLLLFPEKFWKIANRYYNARKSWISSVNYEKLCRFRKMALKRKSFLNFYKNSFIF